MANRRLMNTLRCSLFLIFVISHCLHAQVLKPKIEGAWSENSDKNFPTASQPKESASYFEKYVPESNEYHRVFKPEAFKNIKLVSNITGLFEYSLLSQNKQVQILQTKHIIKESHEFKPIRIEGDLEDLNNFQLKALDAYKYFVKDLKIRFTENQAFNENSPFRSENEKTVLHEHQLANLTTCVTIGTNATEAIELNLYFFLGKKGKYGSVYAETFSLNENVTKIICPKQYFLLNVENFELVLTSESEKKNYEITVSKEVVKEKIEFLIPQNEKEIEIKEENMHSKPPKYSSEEVKIVTGEWYYFNPQFDFDLFSTSNGLNQDVEICDVASNCHRYRYSKNVHTLPKIVKKLLAKTPFVRFAFDESLKNQLKFKEDLPNVLISKLLKVGNNTIRSIEANQEETTLIWMEDFDLRFMDVSIGLKCNGRIQIVSANYPGIDAIDLSFLPVDKNFHFNSKDFFFVEDSEIRQIPNFNITTKNLENTTTTCSIDWTKTGMIFKPSINIADESLTQDATNEHGKDKFLWESKWIRIGEDTSLRDSHFNGAMTFKTTLLPNVTLDHTDVIVHRMTLGKNGMKVVQVDNKNININQSQVTLTENFEDFDETKFGSAFRIGYSVTFPEGTTFKSTGSLNFPVNERKEKNALNSIFDGNDRFKISSCLATFSFDENENTCNMKNSYQSRQFECEPNSCENLLEQPVSKSSVYASNNVESHRYYGLKNAEKQNSLIFENNNSDKKDSCISFTFSAKQSPLRLLFAGTASHIDFINDSKQIRKYCASHYTPYPEKVENFVFEFTKPSQIDNIDDHWVEVGNEAITHGNIGEFQTSQPIFMYDESNNEEYLKKLEEIFLESKDWELKNPEAKNSTKQHLEASSSSASLMTKWIENKNDQLKFGMQFISDNETLFRVTIKTDTGLEKLVIEKNVTGKFSEIVDMTARFESKVQFYQVVFDFENQNESISFRNFYMNDPCHIDVETLKKCSRPGTNYFNRTSYSNCNCECSSKPHAYSGDFCETRNYCLDQDALVCGGDSKKCTNRPKLLTYECECEKNSIWDFQNKKCISLQTECKENEELVAKNSANLTISCDCVEGYIRFNETIGCTKLEVCNDDHREFMKVDKIKCPANSECRPVKTSSPPLEYECHCNDGYFNKANNFGSSSSCLLNNCTLDMTACDHECSENKCFCLSNYLLESESCVPKKSTKELINKLNCTSEDFPKPFINHRDDTCECRKGFSWNATSLLCELVPDHEIYKNNFGCSLVEIKPDHMVGCVCDKDTPIFDAVTRACKRNFEIEQEECKNIRKGVWLKNSCECLSNEIKVLPTDKEKWVCMDKCSLIFDIDVRNNLKCNLPFSYCDAASATFDTLKDLEKDKVFIIENSTVTSSNKIAENSHCKCENGFEFENGECIQKGNSALVNVTMKLRTHPSDTRESMNRIYVSLIKTVFQIRNEPRVTCENPTDGFSKCSADFISQDKPKDISEESLKNRILNSALNVKTSKGFILKMDSEISAPQSVFLMSENLEFDGASKQSRVILVLFDEQSIETKLVNFCEQNPCDAYDSSSCGTLEDTNIVQCTCDLKYYKIKYSSAKTVKVDDMDMEAKFETCKPINLCEDDNFKCEDPIAKCRFTLFRNSSNAIIPEVDCVCPNGIRLFSKSFHCSDCDECNQQGTVTCAFNEKGTICKCKDNYIGDRCQTKIETSENGKPTDDSSKSKNSDKVSKTYVYTTVILAIVAGVGLLLAAILYFRR